MQSQQSAKAAAYTPVVNSAASLYSLLKKMAVLNPLYHVTLQQFSDIIINTIKAQHRGRGTQGKYMLLCYPGK